LVFLSFQSGARLVEVRTPFFTVDAHHCSGGPFSAEPSAIEITWPA
jgi:hypothetical protein